MNHARVKSGGGRALPWIGVAVAGLLLVPTGIQAAGDPAAAKPRPRLLVLDLRADEVSAGTVRTVQDLLTAEIDRLQRYDVVSGAELSRLVELETQRQLTNCDTDDSCLAEIAGALGAGHLVFGSVGKLGDLTLVSLSLFDTQSLRAVRRASLKVEDPGELPERLPAAVVELFDGDSGAVAPEIAESEAGSGPGPWLIGAGGVGFAAAAVVAGLGIWRAYLPYRTTADRIVALEADAPDSLPDAQDAQSDLLRYRNQLLWWSGGAALAALVGGGLVTTGLLIGGDPGEVPEAQP